MQFGNCLNLQQVGVGVGFKRSTCSWWWIRSCWMCHRVTGSRSWLWWVCSDALYKVACRERAGWGPTCTQSRHLVVGYSSQNPTTFLCRTSDTSWREEIPQADHIFDQNVSLIFLWVARAVVQLTLSSWWRPCFGSCSSRWLFCRLWVWRWPRLRTRLRSPRRTTRRLNTRAAKDTEHDTGLNPAGLPAIVTADHES